MNTKLVGSAAGVILAALTQNRTAAGIALALDSAQLLQSPETAAETQRLVDRVVELEAKLAEYERPADEDPIRYTLTEQAEVFVPRTERERWVDIANALNAAHAAGMPVGIDLDGTLTDHRMWSVVWDRAAEQWTVAGYEDDAERAAAADPCHPCGCPKRFDRHAWGCPTLADDVTPQVQKLRGLLAGQRAAVEDPHDSPLHHDYRVGRDLPEVQL